MNFPHLFLVLIVFPRILFAQAPTIGGCPSFPANSIWNTRVDTLPVHARSADYINSIGAAGGIRYDTSMPINLVPGTQPKVALNIAAAAESDPGPYPIPQNVQVEGGDLHIILVDQDNCILYETYNSVLQANGSWNVDSSAKWDLRTNTLRPADWTSADAAGLPIMPGVLRYAEMLSGQINHALRFTAPRTQRAYVWPARHFASSNSSVTLPPMGQRFRLKAGFNISGYSANMQVVLRAIQTYGLMLADNGQAWGLQADPDPRWNTTELLSLRAVLGSNLEAVDVSSLMVSPDSGQVLQPNAVPLTVSPGTATLSASQQQQFSATLSGAAVTAIWSITPKIGVISATGFYTSPASITAAQTVTITAALADGSAKGSATITLATNVTPDHPATIAACPSFPADNIWNAAIDTLPLHPHSADYINSISATGGIRYDTSMPVNLVAGTQAKVPLTIAAVLDSDAGPYPIPPNVQVETGDLHIILVDQDNCELYETYNSVQQPDGSWTVDSAAKWNLRSNALRTAGATAADAAGLPIMPGVLRYSEVLAGQINHALRFTVPKSDRSYVWPARHFASSTSSALLPPMGQRFRLRSSYDISGFSANMQVILRALQKYGMMVSDNGLPWSLQADTDPRWNPSDLLTLRAVVGSNMEAVDATTLMIDIDSGQAKTPSAKAIMNTPAPGSALPGTTVTFNWSAGAGGSAYWLDVGTVQGEGNIFGQNVGLATSQTVSGIPANGVTMYVRLWTLLNGTWLVNDYSYVATGGATLTKAVMTSPTPGSVLSGSTVTFTWSAGSGSAAYWLDVGTIQGQGNIFGQNVGLVTSLSVSSLPLGGTPIYVRLWTQLAGVWQVNDYAYTAGTLASITSPAAGSTFSGTSAVFTWSSAAGADQYWLDVGSVLAQGDYFAMSTTGTSFTVNSLPCDGRPLYVQLWSHLGGVWQSPQRTTYTASPGCAALINPTVTNFAVTTVNFAWNAISGADQYWLDVGSILGQGDVFAGATPGTGFPVNLPCDGRTLYVQVWTHLGGVWKNPGRYIFSAWNACAALTSPVPGSAITGTATFNWTPGSGATAYWLDVGTVPGQGNIFGANLATALTRTVAGIPGGGTPIYVQLWSQIGGVWYPCRYQYTGQ